jgi:hypothetical protein
MKRNINSYGRSYPALFWVTLVLAAVLSFSVGCQTPHKKIQITIPVKEKEKIPLRVGLYLDPKSMNYSKIVPPDYPNLKGIIHMGEALSKGAETVIGSAFKEVVNIYTKDRELIPKGLDALVIPEIEKIYDTVKTRHPEAIVSIKWSIQDINGRILYMNTFTGDVKFKFAAFVSPFERLCEAYTKAIEDQFAKAYIGITSTNWWQTAKKETN